MTMFCTLHLILFASLCSLACSSSPAARGNQPSKSAANTDVRTVQIKYYDRDGVGTPEIVKSIGIELMRLPSGSIKLRTAAGEREYKVASLWMSKFETRWDEYDVFWRELDLKEEDRASYTGPWLRTQPPSM